MVSRRRATVSSALTTGANTLIVALQSFILLPLFLRHIGKPLYGAWAGTGDILLWIQAFDLGLPNLMGQRVATAHSQEDAGLAGRWLATGLLVLIIAALILFAAAMAISASLPRIFANFPAYEIDRLVGAFRLASIASCMVMVNNGVLVYSRAIQRPAFLNAVMTVSSLGNLFVTVFALLHGQGLYSIAYGVLTRSLLQAIASIAFLIVESPKGLHQHFRFDQTVFREAMRLLPSTLIGGLAYAALNQSELLFINLTVGATAAASFLAIRRAAELVRAMSDTVALSSYTSFAHLVSSPERVRACEVLDKLSEMRIALVVILLCPYLAVNSVFISIWLKGEVLPSAFLNVAIAIQSVVIGGAFLANYLYRATGEVMRGSLFLAAEAVIRVGVMYGLSKAIGPIGVPVGSIATALPTWILTEATLRKRLADTPPKRSLNVWIPRLVVLIVSFALGSILAPSWAIVASAALVTFGVALILALATDPSLEDYRRRLPLLRGLRT